MITEKFANKIKGYMKKMYYLPNVDKVDDKTFASMIKEDYEVHTDEEAWDVIDYEYLLIYFE